MVKRQVQQLSQDLWVKDAKIDIYNNLQFSFKNVETPLIDGFIPSPVLKDLSSDQRLLFEYCKGIGCGRVDEQ